MRVGYACICLGEPGLRCQRSTVLRNATPERLRSLIHENLDGLEAILDYNEAHGFRLFRIGNEFIPFASHPVNTLSWWEEYAGRFRAIGRRAKDGGHRLSFHASHYTILNSEQPHVVESALADVTYLGRVLEAMELGAEHKIVLHVGAASPTLDAAGERLLRTLDRVPSGFRRHLVLENDDRLFSLERVLDLARRAGLPVVFDVLHHAVLPGGWGEMPLPELLERVFATWTADDGPPKLHFSSQDREKRPGAHGYGVDAGELEEFLSRSMAVARDFDLMFESKGKDLSLEAVMPVLRADPRFSVLAAPAEGGSKSGRSGDHPPGRAARPSPASGKETHMMHPMVFGVFNDWESARDAVDRLQAQGFAVEDIGMVAGDPREVRELLPGSEGHSSSEREGAIGTGAAAGGLVGVAGGLLLGMAALAIPGLGPVVAAGPLAGALTGALAGASAGGLFGAMTRAGLPEDEARDFEGAVRSGRVLVAVEARGREPEALDTMLSAGASSVSRHPGLGIRHPIAPSESMAGADLAPEERHPDESEADETRAAAGVGRGENAYLD